jgi:hypothetical protein
MVRWISLDNSFFLRSHAQNLPQRVLTVLQTMWRLHPRGPANQGVCVDADGAMLGPDCVLVQRTPSGFRSTHREAARDMQHILLSDKDDPDWLYEQGQRIAKALDQGEIALAQIYDLRIPVRDLDGRQLKQLVAIARLTKAGFNPDEPRIPTGQPGGGEWTGGADTGATALDAEPQTNGTDSSTPVNVAYLQTERPDTGTANLQTDEAGTGGAELEANLIEANYNLSPDLLAIMRALYRIYVTPGSTLASLQDYLAEHGLNFDELPSVIRSLFDPPRPLADLQTDKPPRGFDTEAQLKAYLDDPPPGYEWHHVIEQNGQFRPDLISPEGVRTWIQNTNNMVMVPVIKHFCVSGIMSQKLAVGSDLRVRDAVKFHNPVSQRKVGLDLLRSCGAIQ